MKLIRLELSGFKSFADTVTLTFESGLVFKVRALLWRGQPFLGFDPHKRPV